MLMFIRIMHQSMKLMMMFALFWAVHAVAQTAHNLPIRVEKHKTYSKHLFAFGRNIIIEGEVHEDVGAIFGDVTIRGVVHGNVSVLNGSIIIESGAEVAGDLVCIGGAIDIADPIPEQTKIISLFGPRNRHSERTDVLSSQTSSALFFFKSVLLFLAVILLAYAFPSQVREASFQLGQDPGYAALAGIVALALFAFGLFLAFLLMVIAIGIPLFLLLGSALIAFAGFGHVVVYFWLGQKIRTLVRRTWSLVFSLFVAILGIGFLSGLPWIGTALQILITIFGIGVVVRTRFGTNREWFTRRKRVWSAE